MNKPPTPESEYLVGVASRVAAILTANPLARAAMVSGSAAEGRADRSSDVDLMVYYDALPEDDELVAARARLGGPPRRWSIDERPHGFVEAFLLDGIEVQIAHLTVDQWERDIDAVLGAKEVASPLQKAMSGTLIARPLYGEALVSEWKSRIANFPDGLARAMVRHYLRFFALWGVAEVVARRDAVVWRYEMCVEAAQNLLGVLAGLNRTYYTPFQFKRMHAMIDGLAFAPHDCAERIERLFDADPVKAALEMEELVREVVALVQQHMPEVDTSIAEQRLGWRHQPWAPAVGRC
ncbi:MAG: nucleotidyltransferase domain-containing protein [Phycisphaerales bacterium]|nr:nucleotidyltransferase domain-containing protein [Phycisphaerales bacterium]